MLCSKFPIVYSSLRKLQSVLLQTSRASIPAGR